VIGRDGDREPDPDEVPFKSSYLKPGMAVIDLTAGVRPTRFLREAAERGCAVVPPGRVLIEQVRAHVRRVGGEVPAPVLAGWLAGRLPEE
jgi:shikimate 5-dehydrogenase